MSKATTRIIKKAVSLTLSQSEREFDGCLSFDIIYPIAANNV